MEILESLYYKSEKLDTADRIETKDQLQEVINFVSQFPLSEKYSISAGIEIAELLPNVPVKYTIQLPIFF